MAKFTNMKLFMSWLLAVIIVCVGFYVVFKAMESDQLKITGRAKISLFNEHMDKMFQDKVAMLNRVGRSPLFIQTMRRPTLGSLDEMTNVLDGLRLALSFSIGYVMDTAGTVVACSHYDEGQSLESKNYAFRPYFFNAITGKSGAYAALGITTNRRGIYLSNPIMDPSSKEISGVVVFKLDIEPFEALLEQQKQPTFLTTPEGIIFASNRSAWLYQKTRELNAHELRDIEKYQIFADRPLTMHPFAKKGDYVDVEGVKHWVISVPGINGWTLTSYLSTQQNSKEGLRQRKVLFAIFAMVLCLVTLVHVLLFNIKLRKNSQRLLEQHNQMLGEQVDYKTQELVHAAKLASLGTMIAGIAHELKNHLAVVQGYTEIVSAQTGLSDEVRLYMQKTEGAVNKMRAMIYRLLAFVRKSSDSNLPPVDLNESIEESLALVRARLPAHDIELSLHLDQDLPKVVVDPILMESVFQNLFLNALDAYENIDDGRKRIINVTSHYNTENVVVMFQDNGCGMAEQILARVFDPFFTTKAPGKGTGLGLSLSHGIVKQHGGTMSVSSEVGVGTIFTISFPYPVRNSASQKVDGNEAVVTPKVQS